MGGLGDPPTNQKIGLSPACPAPPPPLLTVLTQKCQFCNFHAVFGHLVQIVPPSPVDPNWEALTTETCSLKII